MLIVGELGTLFLNEGYVSTSNLYTLYHFTHVLFLHLWWFPLLQIAFTRQKDFGKEQRELKWAHAQRTLHGLQVPDTKLFNENNNFSELNQLAEEAKRRAEIAR